MAGSEVKWIRKFLFDMLLGMKPKPLIFMHCDCQLAIAIAKNKAFNDKNWHFMLRHNSMKQLLKNGIIPIDYVKLERNLANPLTKPLGKKQIVEN